tara:strand:+ start:189 stop:347 length:159 start_codon:yes stop_codon:yes gene_type:complete
MPAGVRKHGGHWDIVDKDTGKVKGHSTTKAKAKASAGVRNAASRGAKLGKRK